MVLAAIQARPDAATDDLGHQQGARPETRGPYNGASDLALDVRARQINDIVTPSLLNQSLFESVASVYVRHSTHYRLRFNVSSSSSSDTVMVRALAWNPRWARIILVNSSAMSTFDVSSALPISVPFPPDPAVPIFGRPAAHSRRRGSHPA